jgi:hypothetical protein
MICTGSFACAFLLEMTSLKFIVNLPKGSTESSPDETHNGSANFYLKKNSKAIPSIGIKATKLTLKIIGREMFFS